jgi:hypothetical protein
VVNGADPLDSDSDDDGLSDGDEIAHGSSLVTFDADGDGQWDVDEVTFGSEPAAPNSTYDPQNWQGGAWLAPRPDPAGRGVPLPLGVQARGSPSWRASRSSNRLSPKRAR